MLHVVALVRREAAAGGRLPIITEKCDDWRRVFTTSRGQVAIAPMVPPHLGSEQIIILKTTHDIISTCIWNNSKSS